MHEEPPVIGEGVTVHADDGGCRRGADMREKQMRAEVPAEMAKIVVAPGRAHFVIKPRLAVLAVPAKAKAIAIVLVVASSAFKLFEMSECEGSVT
jgi:hypothetical protein